MRTDVAEIEKTPACSYDIKVHGAICKQLETLTDRILRIFPVIEGSRPRCSSGIEALCHLQNAIETANLLLKYCSESSRLYLALTGEKIVSNFKRTKQKLEKYLSKLQTMVPTILELEISRIVDDLRRAVFIIGSFEQEAAKVLGAILKNDESILSLFGNSKIQALQFVASRIHLTSFKDLLLERRAIHNLLDTVGDTEQPKKRILCYLKCLLRKHGEQVLEGQARYSSIDNDESFFPVLSVKRSINDDSVRISSCDSVSSLCSLVSLNLQIDISNMSLGSEDTSNNPGEFISKYDHNDLSSNPELKFFSSKHELETTLLSNISLLPWDSQISSIEDVQSYLNQKRCNHTLVPLSFNNFVEPLVGFLRAAVYRQDESSQVAAARLLSIGVHLSRSAIQFIDEDVYILLASFLGTSMTKHVLAIFQSSIQRSCGLKLAQSGALSSILEILDTQFKEFHETAIKILRLSTEDPCLLRFLPLDYIPKLTPFLRDNTLSLPCIQIMEKLCQTEEARVLATETKGCIASIIELLDNGNCEEQENGVSILLSFCSKCSKCCSLVIDEGILPALFCIQLNGNERAKAGALELLQLFRNLTEEDEEEEGLPGKMECSADSLQSC